MYSLQSTPGAELTIGKLVAKLLNKSFLKKETFWVDLDDRFVYCYFPCPDPSGSDCCSLDGLKPYTKQSTSINLYSWLTWQDKYFVSQITGGFFKNEFTLVQDYTEPQESLKCGALEHLNMNKEELDFFRENCNVKHRPLCMRQRGPNIDFKIHNSKNRKSQKKKKTKNNKKKERRSKNKNTKRGTRSSGRQSRQLTDTGRPIEMCATVLPALMGNDDN